MLSLIFSQENDFTTNEVVEWIDLKGGKFERIGYNSLDKSPKFLFSCDSKQSQIQVNSEDIHAAWFRKAFFISAKNTDSLEANLEDFLFEEMKEFRKVLYHSLPYCGVKVLGKNNINFYDVNKMRTLLMAQSVGLIIPQTIITNSKEDIVVFKEQHKKVISKPLVSPKFLMSEDKQHSFAMYTSLIDDETLEKLDDVVTPCFIQAYIEKAIELRVFFCEDKYYSAAIFSQNNNRTLTDFRNYGTAPSEGNKFVPFKLGKEIQSKLVLLMDLIGLNTGSIDMILTPIGEYFFLEVNPVGQFGMISHPCNFFLEEKVASYLTT